MDITRILPRIRDWHRVAVLVEVHVGPGFLGRVVLILIISGKFGRTRIRSDVAAVYRFLAGVIALRESPLK